MSVYKRVKLYKGRRVVRWICDIKIEGQPQRRWTFKSETEATTHHDVMRGLYRKGEQIAAQPWTFAKACEPFMVYSRANCATGTHERRESVLRLHLLPVFGPMQLEAITVDAIERFKLAQLQSGASTETINYYLATLISVLRRAHDAQKLRHLPRVKRYRLKSRVRWFTEDEMDTLLARCQSATLKAAVFVAQRTGLRLSELRALQWADVASNGTEHKLIVRHSLDAHGVMGPPKGKRLREVPLTPETVAVLQRLPRSSTWVFPRRDETSLPWDRSKTSRRLRKVLRACGLYAKGIGWHTLRHTYASHLVKAGIQLSRVQQLLGHSSIVMTMRYAHLAPATACDVVCLDRGLRSASTAPSSARG